MIKKYINKKEVDLERKKQEKTIIYDLYVKNFKNNFISHFKHLRQKLTLIFNFITFIVILFDQKYLNICVKTHMI